MTKIGMYMKFLYVFNFFLISFFKIFSEISPPFSFIKAKRIYFLINPGFFLLVVKVPLPNEI